MLFASLARNFDRLEAVSSTIQMTTILAELFKECPAEEIDQAAYLSLGQIAPQFEDINLGISNKGIPKLIAAVTRQQEKKIKESIGKLGDEGLVAEKYAGKIPAQLTVNQVFSGLRSIARISGPGSAEEKTGEMASLLGKATPLEAKYLVRIALGTLRLGIGDKTILAGLSLAFTGTAGNKAELEAAYNTSPDIGHIAKIIALKGIHGIKEIHPEIGRPTQMMLAQRADSILMIIEKMGDTTILCEEKYDGERVQAHSDGKTIRLFSRRLENITHQYPEIIEALRQAVITQRYIIEGEIVPVDSSGNLLPFQVLMQRRRKYEIERSLKKIPVHLFLFDVLYIDNRSLTREPLPMRRGRLEAMTRPNPKISLANRRICAGVESMEDFFNWCLEHGGEGFIAKSQARDSFYQPGKRGWLWIKWKQAYEKMADTFDLVVVGALYGKGKRAGTYGSLLCCLYNDAQDRFETFCKLGGGFTDAQLKEMPDKFSRFKRPHPPARLEVNKNMEMNVWFEPAVVVEVLGGEITKSPSHTAGFEEGSGLSLRFPRFRRYRPDKSPEQATTVKEIRQLPRMTHL
jgi:DNA ligase-1